MKIIKFEEGQVIFAQQGAVGTKLLTAERLEVVHLSIEAGGGIAAHALPYPVIFYVLEGSGTLMVDEAEFTVKPATTIECSPGIQRGWKNLSSSPLKLLVMKSIDASRET